MVDMASIAEERRKILNGTYPSRVVTGRQNKHIEGTTEFEQNQEKMQKSGSKPAILTAGARELVEKYKGKGHIEFDRSSPYPKETIDTDAIVGKTWVASLKKYVDTKRIRIVYSSTGVHIFPVSDYERG